MNRLLPLVASLILSLVLVAVPRSAYADASNATDFVKAKQAQFLTLLK